MSNTFHLISQIQIGNVHDNNKSDTQKKPVLPFNFDIKTIDT